MMITFIASSLITMANSGFKVQFTRHQIDHDHEIVQGAIARALALAAWIRLLIPSSKPFVTRV